MQDTAATVDVVQSCRESRIGPVSFFVNSKLRQPPLLSLPVRWLLAVTVGHVLDEPRQTDSPCQTNWSHDLLGLAFRPR